MVLDDVARHAGLLVELAAPLDADVLGDRDLHVVDVLAPPHGLEERVGEPEDEQVLHRLLAEVVIDAEDLRLVERRRDGVVERARALEVVAERLLEDDAGPEPATPLAGPRGATSRAARSPSTMGPNSVGGTAR